MRKENQKPIAFIHNSIFIVGMFHISTEYLWLRCGFTEYLRVNR